MSGRFARPPGPSGSGIREFLLVAALAGAHGTAAVLAGPESAASEPEGVGHRVEVDVLDWLDGAPRTALRVVTSQLSGTYTVPPAIWWVDSAR